ncbi:hypothetical protein Tcan_05688 [Toxocara canis]|uniref:Uncharacterized protein n=1 Tax=Toxocara canis TaxID=6265 RepID=A0A0B2W5G4_TOXCA|nr:hypothetical protein Tcan_05688 [Toxocara canis]
MLEGRVVPKVMASLTDEVSRFVKRDDKSENDAKSYSSERYLINYEITLGNSTMSAYQMEREYLDSSSSGCLDPTPTGVQAGTTCGGCCTS